MNEHPLDVESLGSAIGGQTEDPAAFDTATGEGRIFNPPCLAKTSAENRQAQAALYESEQRFRQLVEGAPRAFTLTRDIASATSMPPL